MAGSDEVDEGGWQRLRYWMRQESDHQWLSLCVFLVAVVVIALLIEQAAVTPGMEKVTITGPDVRIIDMAWDESGDIALMVAEVDGEMEIKRWQNDSSVTLAFDSPRAVERYDGGWLIAGDDGALGRCQGPCQVIGLMNMDWQSDDQTGNRIVDVISMDGLSGHLLITETGGNSSVRQFSANTVSPAGSIEGDGISLDSLGYGADGDVWAVGYGWFGQNPASSRASGVIASVIGGDAGNGPTILLRYIGSSTYHTILSSGDSTSTLVVGRGDAIQISAEGEFSEVDGVTGASSATFDASGDYWLAGDLNTGRLMRIDANIESAQVVEVTSLDLTVEVATNRGDVVQFHGVDSDSSVSVQFDPEAAAGLSSISHLSRMLFILLGCVVFSVMGWTVWEKSRFG